jgi:hypothetical protein
MITHDTPTSTNIARLLYDQDAGVLKIEFRSGKIYEYEDVSYDLWNQFTTAPSAGKFFNERIKNAYKGRPV